MVEISNLTVTYNETVGLDNFSETIAAGTVTGVVGQNAAGKSTLLRSIAGVNGSFTQQGKIVFRKDWKVAYCPTQTISFLDLTPKENFRLLGTAMDLSTGDLDNRVIGVIDILGLESFADRPVDSLSTGMRRRTDIGLTIMRAAELYVFDEPYTGLDAEGAQVFSDIVRSIAENGRTVVIASHAGDLLLPICEVVWELNSGTLVNCIRAKAGTITKGALLMEQQTQSRNAVLSWIIDR